MRPGAAVVGATGLRVVFQAQLSRFKLLKCKYDFWLKKVGVCACVVRRSSQTHFARVVFCFKVALFSLFQRLIWHPD